MSRPPTRVISINLTIKNILIVITKNRGIVFKPALSLPLLINPIMSPPNTEVNIKNTNI